MANADGSSEGGGGILGTIAAVFTFFVTGGNLQAAAWAYQIGNFVGNALDNPKGPNQYGPRLDSLTLTTSSNVATLPRSYGTVAHKGNLIWAKDGEYIEVATTKKVKTGLFKKTKVTTYTYFFTGAYAFHKGEIEAVLRIWHAGGRDLVYSATSTDLDTQVASAETKKHLTFYYGTADQGIDPLIAGDVGDTSCSAYRGVFYIVYDMYPLENYQNNVGNLDPKVEYTTKPVEAADLEFIVNVPADDAGGQDEWPRLHVLSNFDADAAHLWRLGLGDSGGLTNSIVGYPYRAFPSGELHENGFMTPPYSGGESSHNRPCAGKSDCRVMCAAAVYLTASGGGGGEGSSHPYLLQENYWKIDPITVGGSTWELDSQPFYFFEGTLKDAITSLSTKLLEGPDAFFAALYSTPNPPNNNAQITGYTLDGAFAFALQVVGGGFTHFIITAADPAIYFEGPITPDWFTEGTIYEILVRLWVYDRDRDAVDQIVIDGFTSFPDAQTHYVYYKGHIYFVYVFSQIIRLVKIGHYLNGEPVSGRSESSFNVPGMNPNDPVTVRLVKIGILNDQLIFVCKESDSCVLYTLDLSVDLDGLEDALTEEVMTVMDSAAVLAEFGDNSSDFYNNVSFDFDKMYFCLNGNIYQRNTLLEAEVDLGDAPDLILGDAYPAFFNIFGYGGLLAVSTYGGDMDKTGVQFFSLGAVADPDKVLLADIISAECLLVGLAASDIDVTTIDQEVRGYTVSEIGSVRNVLSQLQACYPFDIIQSGYKAKFVKRGGASVATVTWQDLGQDISLTQEREMESQLPYKVELTYLDKDLNYEANVQFSERPTTSENIVRLNIPIVLTPDEAAQIADVLHSNYFQDRKGAAFKLPPTFRYIEPSDVITLQMKTVSHVVRLTNINSLSTGSMECASKQSLATTYESVAVGEAGPVKPDTIPSIANPIAGTLDIPVINDIQDKPGYHAVVTHTSDSWVGGTLFRARDGVTFEQVQAFSSITVWGTCSTILTSHGGHVVDEGSELIVKPYKGEIESVTETQFLNEETLLAYGKPGRWEILGFKDAVDNADGTHTLSYLMRGRRGTEQYTGTHQAGDYFAFINNGTSKFVAALLTDIDATMTHKAITTGRDLDSASPTSLTYAGVNLKPLSPVDAEVNRDGDGNITGIFSRRSRINGGMNALQLITNGGAPLGEASESYEIDVLDGDDVVRTISVADESFTYSEADQITDFGSAQSEIDIEIYQISATVGRGYAGAFTV